MKKSVKWILPLAVLLCAAVLAGCSLAREDDGYAGQDELVGVFVRFLPNGWEDDHFFEYDDQAVEDYLKAHASEFSGGEIDLSSAVNSGTHVLQDWERDQCILFETLEDENEDGPYTYRSSTIGAVFNMVKQHVTVTDEGESVEVKAEVYIDAAQAFNENIRLDIDPVYRRADGLLCVGSSDGFMGAIGSVSKTIAAEWTAADAGGKETKQSISFEVSAAATPRVERAILVEMDENNQPIDTHEIDLAQDELVERVSPQAAWVLVEARLLDKDWDGEAREKTVRQLIELEDGRGEASLMLPAEQEGMLVLKTLTAAYPGVKLDEGI